MCDCPACRAPSESLLKNRGIGHATIAAFGSISKTYTTSDENHVSPWEMCRREPEWAGITIERLKQEAAVPLATQAALVDAGTTIERLTRERDDYFGALKLMQERAEFAERELSAAFGLPSTIGPVAGEAKRLMDALRSADTNEWKRMSDSWRLAHRRWQEWASRLLAECGRQVLYGEHGDESARQVIAQLAGMAPGVPRCLRCGCFSTRHEPDDEELRGCADCECTAYEDPSPAARKAGA